MGVTMFLQQRLNPAPPDPVQARMFQFMPIIFTFMLAPLPAGLVLYWTWNNLLTVCPTMGHHAPRRDCQSSAVSRQSPARVDEGSG